MFDKRLVAVGDCPIINVTDEADGKPMGDIIFNPNPVITATDDDVLAHELCHLIAGKEDYSIFSTSIIARDDDERFKWLLNALYDWYHEIVGREYSVVISNYLLSLRKRHKIREQKDPEINKILYLLNNEVSLEEGCKILEYDVRDVLDLVVLADKFSKKIKVSTKVLITILMKTRPCSPSLKNKGRSSDYYIRAVGRYYSIIKMLSQLWQRNRYDWQSNYFGEINWRNLPLLMLGDKLNLPVFKIWKKIVMSRNVYIVVDRSGSTHDIENLIMDTAIIITESLLMTGTPISILDVGVECDVINKIDEPVDYGWFTPANDNGTPLGGVCQKIDGDDHDSFLLIITDGIPDSWTTLKAALNKFKGSYLTCVIGNSYREYATIIGNAVQVEPHTIIRSLLSNENAMVEGV